LLTYGLLIPTGGLPFWSLFALLAWDGYFFLPKSFSFPGNSPVCTSCHLLAAMLVLVGCASTCAKKKKKKPCRESLRLDLCASGRRSHSGGSCFWHGSWLSRLSTSISYDEHICVLGALLVPVASSTCNAFCSVSCLPLHIQETVLFTCLTTKPSVALFLTGSIFTPSSVSASFPRSDLLSLPVPSALLYSFFSPNPRIFVLVLALSHYLVPSISLLPLAGSLLNLLHF